MFKTKIVPTNRILRRLPDGSYILEVIEEPSVFDEIFNIPPSPPKPVKWIIYGENWNAFQLLI